MPTIDFDPSTDYYQALGVTEKSTVDEVKKAYRKLARQYHPDSTGGDKAKESKFKTISVAYDVIGNPEKRTLYDQLRANGAHAGGDAFDLSDLFGSFFNPSNIPGGRESTARRGESRRESTTRPSPSAGPRSSPEPKPDTRDTRVQASDKSWLRVDGFDVNSDVVISFDRAILGTMVTVATIDGKADVNIPSGSSSGRKLRLRGKGKFNPGGFTGDHYITVQIEVPDEVDEETKRLVMQVAERLKKKRR